LYACCAPIILAGLVTVIRICMPSRGLDTAHIACGFAGGLAGTVGMLLADRRRPSVEFRVPRSLIVSAEALALLIVLARGMAPFQMDGSIQHIRAQWHAINWLPFAAAQSSRPNDALLDLSTKALQYVILSGLFTWALRRPLHRAVLPVIAASMAVA